MELWNHCENPYPFVPAEVELPEPSRPSQGHRITTRPCLHRTARARSRRRLRSRLIPLLRLNLCRLYQARTQLPILRAPPEHRLPPKSPPYRRLESLTYGTILPGFEWLPWLSRRASQAVLFA